MRPAGQPLLANDPHLALTAPSFWMLARMNLAEGPVIGGTIPGIPAILVGRNADLGWGLTSSYLDDQDIYIERLDPGRSRPLPDPARQPAVRNPSGAVIAVKGADPVTVTLRWTRHGPVIPGDSFGAAAITPPGHVAALAWTGLTADDRSVGAAIALMRAHSIAAARQATRDHLAPSLNVTLADHTSVALQTAGAAPRRMAGHTSKGRIPAPGWLAVNDWQGMRAFETIPYVVDPPSGIVVNTNNKITDAAFPDHLSLRLGRHLPRHPGRPAPRRPPVPFARRLRRDPDRRLSPRTRASSCRSSPATSGTRASPLPPRRPSAAARRRSSASPTGTARCPSIPPSR